MRLYWRLKKKGKWTWRPATVHVRNEYSKFMVARVDLPEEEE
jgi:hypothetical protein